MRVSLLTSGRLDSWTRKVAEVLQHELSTLGVGFDVDRGGADIVLLNFHSSPPANFSSLVENARYVISLTDSCMSCRQLERGDPYILAVVRRYVAYGGVKNFRNLARFLARLLGIDVDYEEPSLDMPLQGIYVGGRVVEKAEVDVALIVERDDLLYGEWVTRLMRVLEERGVTTAAVFTLNRYKYETVASSLPPFAEVLSAVKAKVFVNLAFPSLEADWGSLVLSPARAAVGVGEWLRSEYGLDGVSLSFYVLLPELRGFVEPIVIGGIKDGEFEVYDPHVEYIARRVEKWVNLRRKRPEERRVAVVLIAGNPCEDNREAYLGNAGELDVPQSLLNVLKALREAGYRVEGVPSSGEELVKLAISMGAAGVSRWTTAEEFVERGGALGFVTLEQYLQWFNELPEGVRAEVERHWGRPEDFFSEDGGPILRGAAVIAGLKFGNVVVLMEPSPLVVVGKDFRYCDAEYWKRAHASPVPPNHYYIAFYRWITRAFKADVVLTFGTHALHEFRPGKSVGLSPYCWPEILIDDVPHAYIYMVSNPGEGLVAKRRGYSVLVDHLDWPLKIVDTAGALELIAQYLKARQSGQRDLQDALLEKLKKTAASLGVQGEGDELVYSLLTRIDSISDMAVETGLHIFGESPQDLETLAEWVYAVLSRNTLYTRSIRDVVREILGGCSETDRCPEFEAEVDRVSRELVRRAILNGVDDAIAWLRSYGRVA